MKRTSLATRNTRFSLANAPGGTVALVVVLATLLFRLAAPNAFWHTVAPVFRAGDALTEKSRNVLNVFGDAARLAGENEMLVREKTALETENRLLREQVRNLGALGAGQGADALAGVVARPPQSPYDTLVLGAGSADGVRLGQEAFADGGVPIGVVTTVLPDFSRVTLFSAPGMETNGWVGDTALTLTGTGGSTLRATMSRVAGIEPGATVFVPGPGKLPFGTVVGVDEDPSSPSAILRVQPQVNLFSIPWVSLRDTGAELYAPLCSITPSLP